MFISLMELECANRIELYYQDINVINSPRTGLLSTMGVIMTMLFSVASAYCQFQCILVKSNLH